MRLLGLFRKSSAPISSGPGPFGKYQLHELIARGGMADIWLATDADGRPHALRKLHDKLRFNFLARRRFLRGCAILKAIQAARALDTNADGVITAEEFGRLVDKDESCEVDMVGFMKAWAARLRDPAELLQETEDRFKTRSEQKKLLSQIELVVDPFHNIGSLAQR